MSMLAFFIFFVNSFICHLFVLSCLKPSAFACVSGAWADEEEVWPRLRRVGDLGDSRRNLWRTSNAVSCNKRIFIKANWLQELKPCSLLEEQKTRWGGGLAFLGVKVGSQAVCPEPTRTCACKSDTSVSARNSQLS